MRQCGETARLRARRSWSSEWQCGWGEVLRALAQSDRGLPSGQYRTGGELRELFIVMGSGPRRANHQTGWDSETVKHP
jgi:hypothetical protein